MATSTTAARTLSKAITTGIPGAVSSSPSASATSTTPATTAIAALSGSRACACMLTTDLSLEGESLKRRLNLARSLAHGNRLRWSFPQPACLIAKLLQLALNRTIAEMFILQHAIRIDRERVRNSIHSKEPGKRALEASIPRLQPCHLILRNECPPFLVVRI